jgi:hypothetical protein
MERENLHECSVGRKKMTVSAVALPCFSLLPHTVEVINAAADKPDWNVSFCY